MEQLTEAINQIPHRQGSGNPPCGEHAVGRPTHQSAVGHPILVVGEAPAADGWWVTGRAFYRRTAAGTLLRSRTGANLNDCLAVLGTAIEEVGFIEAVRCRPEEPGSWHPRGPVRRRCLPFLERHLVCSFLREKALTNRHRRIMGTTRSPFLGGGSHGSNPFPQTI
jgi:uracil-DNA glycosylase